MTKVCHFPEYLEILKRNNIPPFATLKCKFGEIPAYIWPDGSYIFTNFTYLTFHIAKLVNVQTFELKYCQITIKATVPNQNMVKIAYFSSIVSDYVFQNHINESALAYSASEIDETDMVKQVCQQGNQIVANVLEFSFIDTKCHLLLDLSCLTSNVRSPS